MKQQLHCYFFSILFICAISISTNAQTLQYQWANALISTDNVNVAKVIADNRGNIYVTGLINAETDFDPGSGIANLTSSYFIAKYDAQGNYIFAHEFTPHIIDIAFDRDSNIILAGNYSSGFDFDLGSGVANFTEGVLFAAKYDTDFNYISGFGFAVGGTSRGIESIGVDAANNLYITGKFWGTIDFDPSSGTYNLTSTTGDEDVYLASYTANGSMNYAFSVKAHYCYDLAVDNAGNAYLSGGFNDPFDVDPGANIVTLTSVGGVDGFWAKYDAAGNYIKAYAYDGGVNLLTLDKDNNLYITGRVPDSMDVDLGPGVTMLHSDTYFDIYIVKYDVNDNLIYGKVYESDLSYIQNDILTDNENNLFMCGWILDTTNFTPGSSTGILTSQGMHDIFLIKLNAIGNYISGGSMGSADNDQPNDLAIDKKGNVWMVGLFKETVDADFGPAVHNMVGNNVSSGFIAKYHDDSFTAIAEDETALPIKLYGAENTIFIDFSALLKVNAQVQLLNLMGQTVFETTHNQNNKLQIALPETAGGIYFVRVINEGQIISKKLWVK